MSFSRILTELAEWYKPEWDLDRGGKQLVKFFDRVRFGEEEFRGVKTNRLLKLKSLDQQGLLGSDLRLKGL